MRNLLLIVLLGVAMVGCGRDMNRGETCALNFRFTVMERLNFFDYHFYWWLDPVMNKDGKPIPCEAK